MGGLTPLPGETELRAAERRVRRSYPASRRPVALSDGRIGELAQALDRMRYAPRPYRGQAIPKRAGVRLLAVPRFEDRIVARAMLDRLGERADAVLSNASHAWRPGRGVSTAMGAARSWYRDGYRWTLELDVHDCFGSVTAWAVRRALRKIRSTEAETEIVLRLIRCPIATANGLVRPTGLPQGLCLSPMLANLVLDALDRRMAAEGFRHVRYGDDILIALDSAGMAKTARAFVEASLAGLGMRLADEKVRRARICRLESWLGRPLLPPRPLRPKSFFVV